MTRLNLGMVGCGVVGTGVYNIVQSKLKDKVQITKICVRDLTRPRPDLLLNQEETTLVSTIEDMLLDSTIDGILELMGGTKEAKDLVFRALEKGLHVITANKALVAECFHELVKTLGQSSNQYFGYEAAVCGGIPIIHTLNECYAGHETIRSIRGIFNGTTNFMLSKMAADATLKYSEVLKEAQDLGFAEADPTADVDGFDVQRKLFILGKLAFGQIVTLRPQDIPIEGIRGISPEDFQNAQSLGYTIKMVGFGARRNDHVELWVAPALVPLKSILASVSGATNLVVVESESLGQSMLIGEGAGRYPTAHSVISDIVRCVKHTESEFNSLQQAFPSVAATRAPVQFQPDFASHFYLRLIISCEKVKRNVVKALGDFAEEAQVPICTLAQSWLPEATVKNTVPEVHCVLTTDRVHKRQVQRFVEALRRQNICRDTPNVFPILH